MVLRLNIGSFEIGQAKRGDDSYQVSEEFTLQVPPCEVDLPPGNRECNLRAS